MLRTRHSRTALAGATNLLAIAFAGSILGFGQDLGPEATPDALASPLVQQGGKLVPSDYTGTQIGFGRGVALSFDGNTAVIGGPGDNGGKGAAWVFLRGSGAWRQSGTKLTGSDATGGAAFGASVALSSDGNTALVGGYGDGGGVGAAWVFTQAGGSWNQQGSKLIGSGAAGVAGQGWSVALSADGNTAVLGGENDDGAVGAAWVFVRSGGAWVQQGAKLTARDAAGTSLQGSSVALSSDGNTVAIGGCGDNGVSGAAWVYTRANGVWSQQGLKLTGSGASGSACQGASLSLSADGNTLLLGGSSDNNFTGAAWVFVRANGVWTQQGGKLIGTGAQGAAFQGISAALSADGSEAFVGGWQDNGSAGAAWAYNRTGTSWGQVGPKLVGAGADGKPSLGYSAALSGDGATAVAGGSWDANFLGAAWVFGATPGLFISVSHSGTFVPGQAGAAFTIGVSNQANSGPTSGLVTVTENPPPGLNITAMTGAGWSCTLNSCVRGDALNGGGSYPPIAVAVSVASGAPSPLTNSVSVSGGGFATRTATDTVVLTQLQITSTHSGNFAQGGTYTYSITATNLSANPVTGLVVTETVPPSFVLLSFAGNGWSCSGFVCSQVQTLSPGASSSLSATVSVAANSPASVTNQVTLAGGGLIQPLTALDPTVVTASGSFVFVRQQYRDLLDREPDPGGLAFWQTVLNQGAFTQAGLAAAFLGGQEFGNLGYKVIKLYLAVLGRAPAITEWKSWQDSFRAGTDTIGLINSLATSAEYSNRFGANLPASQFLTLAYRNILGRDPDPGGLSYWTGVLNSGQISQTVLIGSFALGLEFENLMRSKVYANACFLAFLRRNGDAGSVSSLSSQLDGGASLGVVVGQIVGSPEYQTRLAQIQP